MDITFIGQLQDNKPPADFKDAISRLLSDHPSGIPLEDLPVFFKVSTSWCTLIC